MIEFRIKSAIGAEGVKIYPAGAPPRNVNSIVAWWKDGLSATYNTFAELNEEEVAKAIRDLDEQRNGPPSLVETMRA